jgi:NTE family protein
LNAARRALVLGGGGFAASAWEAGLISGVARTGVDLRDCDMFLGTSSGARVAVHLASRSSLDELFHRQLGPVPGGSGPTFAVDWHRVRTEWARAKEIGGGSAAILRRVGELALEMAASDGGERRKVVAAQLPTRTWPEKALLIVAVNAETGERRAFDRNTGIDLVDAVMATTAFWGWPPAFFDGHHYIDGGFYSSVNADLASGFDQVLVLALRPPAASLSLASLDDAVESLRAAGAEVEVVHPDKDCLEALASAGGPFNPAVRAPAAKTGREQGQRLGAILSQRSWR